MNEPLAIVADLNAIDPTGCIRLNCNGTIADIERLGIVLHEGLRLHVADADLEADIVVEASPDPFGWRGRFVGPIRYLDEPVG